MLGGAPPNRLEAIAPELALKKISAQNFDVIDAFGNVYPCAMLNEETGLGNIRESELDAIWGSKRYRKLRALIEQRNRGEFELPICQRCCRFADVQSI